MKSGRRILFIACSFLTGWTSLVMQSVWYRSIASLIGADARAQSFIVGLFLAGLAAGYFFWGKVGASGHSLIGYGLLELVLGLYAAVFPTLVSGAGGVLSQWPSSVFLDFLMTAILIVPAAFLMGGTIPLLTAGLPETLEEVPRFHARVYGMNTLGAGLGILSGGIVLIPSFGLSVSLFLCAVVNIFVFLAILFAAHGDTLRQPTIHEQTAVSETVANWALLTLALLSGITTIGLELLMIRVLNLAAGPVVTTYPMVVGVFIIGLGLGPFYGSRRVGSISILMRTLAWVTLAVVALPFAIPWFTLWLNWLHGIVRASNLVDAYVVGHFVTLILCAFLLFPVLIPMGRVLPLLFELMPKTSKNFSSLCGRLYFINTIGCLTGAIGVGHYAFYQLSLPAVFTLVSVLAAVSFALVLSTQKKYLVALTAFAAVLAIVFAFPMDRATHVQGLYENRDGLDPFEIPRIPGEVMLLRDDPLGTVTVVKHPAKRVMIPPFGKDPFFYSVLINGKPDGATYADSLTTSFLAILPYLHHSGTALRTSVIGYGTGLTAGVLARAAETTSVDVVEISSALLAATPLLETQNLAPLSSEKTRIVTEDAFRFLGSRRGEFDIVVSEPSGVWVAGSDGLYTEEFYDRVSASLREGGIFMNWIHLYNNDKKGFSTVYQSMKRRFKHVRGYLLSGGVDIGIMASNTPFVAPPLSRRFSEKEISEIARFFSIEAPDDLNMNLLLPGETGSSESMTDFPGNTLDHPFLGYHGARNRFLGSFFDIRNDPEFGDKGRVFHSSRKTATYLRAFANREAAKGFLHNCAEPGASARNPACDYAAFLENRYRAWMTSRPDTAEHQQAGDTLRRLGFFISDQTLVRPSKIVPDKFHAPTMLDLVYDREAQRPWIWRNFESSSLH